MGKYLGRSIAGLFISLGISLFIINLFQIPLDQVLAIPPALLLSSILLGLVRFTAQGLRLHLLLIKFADIRIGFTGAIILRGASEFFALTTIPFIADEAARTWLLTKRGESVGRAFWISLTEMILDTVVGGFIAVISGLYALIQHIYYIALPILVISIFQIMAVLVFIVAVKSANEGLIVDVVRRLAARLPLPRELRDKVGHGWGDAVRSLISWNNLPLFSAQLVTSFVVMSTPALVLYLILSDAVRYGFLESLYAFHSGNTLGLLPITVGGSGLTEAGVYLYLSGVLGLVSPATVIQWRIATYYIPLIISGIMLIQAVLKRQGA
jgi:uncharacterized protein (TIRG00374 family)